jgi:hypothetical protein
VILLALLQALPLLVLLLVLALLQALILLVILLLLVLPQVLLLLSQVLPPTFMTTALLSSKPTHRMSSAAPPLVPWMMHLPHTPCGDPMPSPLLLISSHPSFSRPPFQL